MTSQSPTDHIRMFSKQWFAETIDALLELDARREMVANADGVAEKMIALSKKTIQQRSSGQLALFGGADDEAAPVEPIDFLDGLHKRCSLMDALRAEREYLGGGLRIHPVDLASLCAILGINANDPNFVLADRLVEIYDLLNF